MRRTAPGDRARAISARQAFTRRGATDSRCPRASLGDVDPYPDPNDTNDPGHSRDDLFGERDRGDDQEGNDHLGGRSEHVGVNQLMPETMFHRTVWDELRGGVHRGLSHDRAADELQQTAMATGQAEPQRCNQRGDHTKRGYMQGRLASREVGEHGHDDCQHRSGRQRAAAGLSEFAAQAHSHRVRTASPVRVPPPAEDARSRTAAEVPLAVSNTDSGSSQRARSQRPPSGPGRRCPPGARGVLVKHSSAIGRRTFKIGSDQERNVQASFPISSRLWVGARTSCGRSSTTTMHS